MNAQAGFEKSVCFVLLCSADYILIVGKQVDYSNETPGGFIGRIELSVGSNFLTGSIWD